MKTIPQNQKAPAALPSLIPVSIYARVSTENQVGGRFDSCESQASICREHLRRKADAGWHEFVCLTDAAYSGGTMERPGMQELKRLIAAGRVKVVLIYKLERVLRSTAEWGPFRAFLRQHDCLLESATEDLSEGTPSGRFKNNILISAAEYERENTAEKTRTKMREQARRGFWNGGMVPFGYEYDASRQSLLPHPTEASLVRRMFEQAAGLRLLADIANALNAEGHRTKARIWTRRDGRQENVGSNRFRDDGIRLILANPIYRGIIRFGGEEFPGNHQALVTDKLWEQANAAIAKVPPPRECPLFINRDIHGNMLKGLLRCGHCECALVPHATGKLSPKKRTYRYYDCLQIGRKNRASPCPVGRIPAQVLEATVVGFLTQLAQHPEVVRSALAKERTGRSVAREPLRAGLKSTEGRLAETEQKIRNLVDAIAAGGAAAITRELIEQTARLRDQKQDLMVRREQQRQDLKACDEALVAQHHIVGAVGRLSDTLPHLTAEEQKELLRLFLHRITVQAKPTDSNQARRQLSVEYQIALPKLVESMQEKVVVRKSSNALIGPRRNTLTLSSTITLGARAGRDSSAIVAPFEHWVRPSSATDQAKPAKATHPIHRALAWREQLRRDPALKKQTIAEREGLMPSALSHHFKMLALTPAIQRFLRELTDPEAVHYFSLRKMRRLADLPAARQTTVFKEMRHSFNAGLSVP